MSDPDTTYDVLFDGEIIEGFDPATVQASFGRAAGAGSEQVRSIFSTRGSVLKRGLAEDEARRFQGALRGIGMATVLRLASTAGSEDTATAATPAPLRAAAPITLERPELQAVGEPQTLDFEFTGDGQEYFKIWIVNLLLTIVTLGIYSAWAKVRSHRYFYGNTRLDGSGFEYLASPIAILKGRLIALAFLVILALSNEFMPLLGLALSLALVALLPWIAVRALAFRAHNSAWRNIRFGFSAHTMDAAKAFVLWPLAGVLTLGILMPLAVYRQKRFIVEHSRFGGTPFAFHGEPREFYRIFLGAVGILLGGGIVVALVSGVLPLLALPGMLAVYLVAFSFFNVGMTNAVYNATSLGEHALGAAYEVSSYAKLYLVNGIGMLLTLGLFYPWAKVRIAQYAAAHKQFFAAGDLDRFVAQAGQEVRATGEEVGEMLGVDFGL
jgi:uncharacterized membrane protein YjgN (DUF898 family)